MTTTFLQELLFRKLVCSWLAPYSIVTALVSTSLFFLFHMPTNLAHLFLYIGLEWDWLSLWSTKKDKIYQQLSRFISYGIFSP
ncbi:type II CAAX prenyl endopeptidase Rce1 family protein [Streptococcus thermophilus]